MRRLVTALAILSAILVNMLGFNPGATHAQDTTVSPGSVLSNPLVLTNKVTHAQVQMMPTTAWLAQHASSPTSAAGSPTTTPAASPCTLASDTSHGDAHVLVNNSSIQYDSLDLASFGLSSDTTTVTGQINVDSLNNGPGGTPTIGGGSNIWYIVWHYGSTPGIKGYFLEAQYPGSPNRTGFVNDATSSNLPVNLSWGTIGTSATGGDQFTAGGPAVAAGSSFDTAHGRITISAKLSDVGNAKKGEVLSSPIAEADALVGTPASGGLLETADSLASTSADYLVGQATPNCPSAKTTATASGALPTAGDPNNLSYFGGPIVHSIKNYIIWWLPQTGTQTYGDKNNTSCTVPGTIPYSYEQPASGTATVGALPGGPDGDTDYQNIIRQYFHDLSGTSFYNLLSQYADQETGATVNNQSLAAEWTDHCGYTSTPSTTTGPVPGGTEAAPVYQTDIQAEVQRAIDINGWPTGMGNEYYVYTGYGVADCFAPPGQASLKPTCSVAGPNPGYCAYHGDFQDAHGNYVLYANMADGAFAANPGAINLCYQAPIGVNDPSHTVNGKPVKDPIADAEVSITSHEQFETVNDAQVGTAQQYAPPLGWYEIVNGEIGDKCAYKYGSVAADGSNVTLHGNHYIVQQEYSNWNNGCGLAPYASNDSYGGASAAVAIQKGLNLISVPVSGITNTKSLAADMTRKGQLPTGSITQIQLYRNSKLQTYTPGKGKPITLTRTDGILVTSNAAGTWTPTGTPYTTAPTLHLKKGLNLVAATFPNPGLMTDSIYNQIAAQAGACKANILTNAPCDATITEIKTIGAGGKELSWKPASPDGQGFASWPQTLGNQIPFTNGMWITAAKDLTWTVQGSQCGTVDASGVCH